jgi:hypothetical protein
MWEQYIGNHQLGSGGYRGKQKNWDKEDAELIHQGLANPWEKITDVKVRNFVRACYYWDKDTMEFVTDYLELRNFEAVLVRNLPRISSPLRSN